MYDFSELEPTGKDVATLILIVFALLLGAGFAGYCIGWERAEDVYCNGSGTESIGNEIGNAESNISNAADGIKEAAGTADQIGSSIKDAKDTAGYIHSTAADSATIISECQSILEGIRRRGKADQAAH